jgi:ferredoxin
MRTETGAIVLAAVGEFQDGDFRVHIVAAVAGFTSLALLWLATVWGVVLRAGWGFSRVKQSKLYAFHRTTATMGLALGIVHALTQLAAPSGTIEWWDEFIPFINETDPLGTGLGILGLELIIAVVVSTMIQRIVGSNRWRALHATAYLSFTMVSAHTLISGAEVTLWPDYTWVAVLIITGWAITVVLGLFTVVRPKWLFPREAEQTAIAAEVGPDSDVPVHVDPLRCTRFGFCQHEAPALFQLRSDGSLSHQSSVGPDQMGAAVQAARGCPARAITLGTSPPPGKVSTGSLPALPAGAATGSGPVLRAVPTSPAVGPVAQPPSRPAYQQQPVSQQMPAMSSQQMPAQQMPMSPQMPASQQMYRPVQPQPAYQGGGPQIYEPVPATPRRADPPPAPPRMPLRENPSIPSAHGHLRAVPSPPDAPGHRAGEPGRHHRRD